MLNLMCQSKKDSTLLSPLKLAGIIGNTMPEWYPGKHIRTAQNFSRQKHDSISDCFRILIYMVSNGIRLENPIEWDMLTAVMRAEIANYQIDLKKLRSESITIRAFFDVVFQNEIRFTTKTFPKHVKNDHHLQRPLDLIKWLLEAGQDPNCRLKPVPGEHPIPIKRAIKAGHVELVQLLLRFHALVDASVITATMRSYNSDAVKLRLSKLFMLYRNFVGLGEILCAAILLQDEEFVEEILQQEIDVTANQFERADESIVEEEDRYMPEMEEECLDHITPLSVAVRVGGNFPNLVLSHASVKDRVADCITPDVLISAAIRGDIKIMRRLLAIQPLGYACNSKGITPLSAAVAYGHAPLCEFLFPLHEGPSSVLLLLAASRGYDDVLLLLINCGGCVDTFLNIIDVGWVEYLVINLSCIQESRSILTIVLTLLKEGPIYDDEGYVQYCMAILINAGAKIAGGQVADIAGEWLENALEAAISAGGDPNDRDETGRTALQRVLEPDKRRNRFGGRPFQVTKLLLESGARLVGGEVVDAIRLKDQELMMFLLYHGGTLRERDSQGVSCLEASILTESRSFLQEVLEASDDEVDAGPFCAAIRRHDWVAVQQLLTRPHKQTEYYLLEGTAIGLAARSGHISILEGLLDRFTHRSALQSALLPFKYCIGPYRGPEPFNSFENIGTIQETRDKVDYWRGNPSRGSSDPRHVLGSPLALAALGNDSSCFRRLLQAGCCIDSIALAIIAGTKERSEYLNILREYRQEYVSPIPSHLEMITPLCIAIYRRNDQMARFFVEAGANINEHDLTIKHNLSPLQCVVKVANLDMVRYLLEKGSNVNAPPAFDRGVTALQQAAMEGHLGIATHLLEYGAGVNARRARQNGVSALEGAAQCGRLDMLELLLHHGAANARLERQQLATAVCLATREAHHAAAKWLKDHCVWTNEDQEMMENGKHLGYGCLRCRYRCDEIHGSDTDCTHNMIL